MIPDIAFEWNLHAESAYTMGTILRGKLEASPQLPFADMQPGKAYYLKESSQYQPRDLVFYCVRFTPGGMAIGTDPKRTEKRLKPKDWLGTVAEMSPELLSLVGITHREIVAEAHRRGLPVPCENRRDYPGLFVDIPDRFADIGSFRNPEETLKEFIQPFRWSRSGPVGPDDVDEWIKRRTKEYEDTALYWSRVSAENPNTTMDIGQARTEYMRHVDYYRWIQSLLIPGGVFAMEAA